MQIAHLILIGITAGIAAGLFGVGGGLIIVPWLVFLCGFKLHTAIGTSLGALLLPVGILGVLEFYKSNHVNVQTALLIALGLLIGTYIGAKIVIPLSPLTLRRIYATFLAFMAVKMFIGK